MMVSFTEAITLSMIMKPQTHTWDNTGRSHIFAPSSKAGHSRAEHLGWNQYKILRRDKKIPVAAIANEMASTIRVP